MTCQVRIHAGDNGSVSPQGEFEVEQSSHVYILAEPEPGYQVEMWYINGNQLYGGTKQFRVTATSNVLEIRVTFSRTQ